MKRTQILILLAAVGSLGAMIGALPDWSAAMTPAFLGAALANLSMQIAGLLSEPKR
jgi:hypothetical protein